MSRKQAFSCSFCQWLFPDRSRYLNPQIFTSDDITSTLAEENGLQGHKALAQKNKQMNFTGFAFTTVTPKDSSVQAVFEFKVMIHLGF